MTKTIPSIDLSKLVSGSTGVGTAQLGPTTEAPGASDGSGAFRTVCEFSHMAFDDPIVFPNQSGKSHLHVFFGNTGLNAGSTAASIANTGNSTCRGGTVNRTGYWAPAIIDTATGTPLKPDSIVVYYKTGYSVQASTIQPMPAGLRMIAGSPGASLVTHGPSKFSCLDSRTGLGPTSSGMPTDCAAGNMVWMTVMFPQCWDGINLDSPDHKSHMAYPGAQCPATHPVALPEVTTNVIYTVPSGDTRSWRLSSDSYDPSLPAGASAHADWFNGWRPDVMDTFVRNCDQAAKDCHAHLLGNGQRMLGVGIF